MKSLFDSVLANTQNSTQANPLSSVVSQTHQIEKAKDLGVFTVENHPISGPYGTIEGKRGLFVNGRNINIVSDRYEIHQPSEIIQQFTDVTASHGLSVNKMKLNPLNGGLLLSANYAKVRILGEEHDINLTFYTSHCGKYKTFLTLDALRIACFNQVPMLYKNKNRHLISEKHYQNSLNVELLGKKLADIPAAIEALSEKAQLLNDTKLSWNQFLDMYVEHNKMDATSKQFESKVEKLRRTYFDAPGQKHLDNSAYKAWQTITYQNTHDLRDTKYQEETRITKAADDSLEFMELLLAEAVH